MSTAPAPASLVDLAAARQLPRHQYTDAATIEWIKANRPTFPPAWPPPLREATRTLIARASIPEAWLAEPKLADSIHGLRHSMRTAVLTALLADWYGLDEATTATAVVAAALHDSQRLHDQDDHGHGARAALWLAANADLVWRHFGLGAAPRRVIQAATAIRLHDVPYEAFSSDDQAGYARAARICDLVKVADALDRYRLPKLSWWPDARHVREQAFDQLRALAFDLVVISEAAYLAGAGNAAAVAYAVAEKGLV